MPTQNTGNGNDKVVSKTLASASENADSPVVVVSGNKLIIAYEQGGNIKYRTSADGGNNISTPKDLSQNTRYPYIFFDGNNVSVMVTKLGGTLATTTLYEINGTFTIQNNGAASISGIKEESIRGILNDDGIAGGNTALLSKKYFDQSQRVIRTAAGAGTGIGKTRKLPLSEVGEIALILEAKESTTHKGELDWDLKAGSKISNKSREDVLKIDASGNTYKTSEAAEKSEGYSIKKDGTITGIGSSSIKVGDGTTDASIAADGNGNIYTLTKEKSGLVLRKFSVKITQTDIK